MQRSLPIAGLAILCFSTTPATAQQFTVDGTALPAQNIWTDGVAFSDVDMDGFVDILFANGQGYGSGGALQQHLFMNHSGGVPGKFSAAHGNLNVANFNAKMVIAEDFDNDGDPDLMYAPEGQFPSPNQTPRMLINDGTGMFADQSAARLPAAGMASFCVCAGDTDDDGDLDVVFTDGATFGGVATQARLYQNNGSGVFSNVTTTALPADTYNAQDVTLIDWDKDFDLDIALSGKGATNKRARLYLNNGAGVFSISNALNALGSGGTYEIDSGDLDGDGDPDALTQSISGSSEGWGRNDGPTTTVPEFTFPSPNGDDDNEMAGLDYDNDGDVDVFVGSLGNREKAYRNNGGGSFTNVNSIIQAQDDSTLDFGFADLDNDGDYDMVTGQGESGNFTNKVYKNAGPRDSQPPRLLALQTAPPLAAPRTPFHVTLQDAIVDDGKSYLTVEYIFATDDGANSTSGSGTARHSGGGTFRAQVDTQLSVNSISLAWIARDPGGNASAFGSVSAGAPSAYTDLGNGLEGQRGVPVLLGVGALKPSTPGILKLTKARANSPAFLLVGTAAGNVPFMGGVLVPFPVILQVNLATNAEGEITLPFVWPAAVPSGTNVFLQTLISDAAAVQGFAFSNGLQMTSP